MNNTIKKSLIQIIVIILAMSGPALVRSHGADQGSSQWRPSTSASKLPPIDQEKLAATLLKLHLDIQAMKEQVNRFPASDKSSLDRIATMESVVAQLADKMNAISESVYRASRVGEHVIVIKDSIDGLGLQLADIRKDIDRLRQQRNGTRQLPQAETGLVSPVQSPSAAPSMSSTMRMPSTNANSVVVPSE